VEEEDEQESTDGEMTKKKNTMPRRCHDK